MRYIGSCTFDNIEYSTYFLQVVTPTFIKNSALKRDLIELLSETNCTLVLRDVLRNYYPDVAAFIETNNIKIRPLITDFTKGANTMLDQAGTVYLKGNYGVNLLIEKGSQDETLLCLTANVTPLL